ncbi:hypothetical protein NGF75_15130 [Dietzia kunjamensis]|uniref:hypothetical protein n=1 Tax=Dietzia kunjamensis TaxID=322509 RepID=UPI002DB6726E|nr:hypothetical protein [Dietzia kunjamensis]MEB8327312.1 hypothetical protein [Dietzia kunjamensis]
MFTRKVVTASAAALTLVALSVPVVNAQDDDALPGETASGSISLGSLEGGDPDASSLAGGSGEASDDATDDASGADGADGEGADAGSLGGGSLGSLESGSLDSGSGDDTSVGDLAPETDEVCELPALGGSVAKFYPLFGIDGVPTGVIDLITSALDPFPNLLDMVAGEGRGSALVGEAGSLSEGLCSLVFGGEMVPPPVTVIVDGDGNPVSTVTGTATASSTTSSPATTTTVVDEAGIGGSVAASGDAGTDGVDADDADTGDVALATSVPVPGA